ncbi:2-hydroxyacid dehydrogenase [Fulvivirgaceae bacterium LMO-SS25]
MSIAIIAPPRNVDSWLIHFTELYPGETVEVWPNITKPDEVECALVWYHPEGCLQDFPNLKMICSMGAGVDHIMRDHALPVGIPITRIVDDLLAKSMTRYIITCILNFHRRFLKYAEDKKERVWDMKNPEIDVRVGILGIGQLGQDLARKLQLLDIDVIGFSRGAKSIDNIPTQHGENEMDKFLSQINILVCLLPLTKETEGILNRDLFRKMNKNTCLINVARGKHLIEDDLIWAIENEIISEAYLDVFDEEPLDIRHPFWNKREVFITPHIASVTNPLAAIPQVVNNLNNARHDKPLSHQVDMSKGY